MKTAILALALSLTAQAQAGIKILSAKLNAETSKIHAVLESDNFCAARAGHELRLEYCRKRTDGPCFYRVVQKPLRIRIGCPTIENKQFHEVIDIEPYVASPLITVYLLDDEDNQVLLKQGHGHRCGSAAGGVKRCGRPAGDE